MDKQTLIDALEGARHASAIIGRASAAQRTEALMVLARLLREEVPALLGANALDLERGRERGLSEPFLDRLELSPARIEGIAAAVEEIAAQPDPVGERSVEQRRPNGLRVCQERIPLGVICMIYESRPNVTVDAAALAIRSGNAVVLRGGSDARSSNEALGELVSRALAEVELPEQAACVLATMPRELLPVLLEQRELVDLVIPRGGPGLIERVADLSKIPVIYHYRGNCHLYLHEDAPADRAHAIALNAKLSRPSVCNAAETLLVHEAAAERLLPAIGRDLVAGGAKLHACERSLELFKEHGVEAELATDEDWYEEYLSLDLAVRIVPSLDEAIAHIQRWSSDHTEAIITESVTAMDIFLAAIQSSTVMVNASTRFADGGELGLGAEVGISTSKLHAYGPMGARELTTTRFVVRGEGQVR